MKRKGNYTVGAQKRYKKDYTKVAKAVVDYAKLNPPQKARFRAGLGLASPTAYAGYVARKFRNPGPQFIKKAAAKMIQRRGRGATMSKSAGFFRKGTKKLQTLDYFAKKGVVVSREKGGVLSTTTLEQAESMAVGHALFSTVSIEYSCAVALLKLFATQMKLAIYDFRDKVIRPGSGNPSGSPFGELKIAVLPLPTDTPVVYPYNIKDFTTWNELVVWLTNSVFPVYSLHRSSKLLYMSFEFDLNTFESGDGPVPYNSQRRCWDLTKARISLYSKSSLKIQNRTISSSGNDQADDVDNVPLHGKSYNGKGNYLGYFKLDSESEPYYAPMKYLTIDTTDVATERSGIMTGKFNSVHPLCEPPVKSVLRNVSGVGVVHLEPGEIKTDVLFFNSTMLLNSLLSKIYVSDVADRLHSFGQYRVLLFEKMIQAVGTTTTNGISLAYEVDSKVASYITAPETFSTNYIVEISPV